MNEERFLDTTTTIIVIQTLNSFLFIITVLLYSIFPMSALLPSSFSSFSPLTFETVRQRMESFCSDREWQQFHTPRNLLLALVGEVGELSEIFQWKGELSPGLPDFTVSERVHLGEELSDVLLYLVRLSDMCGIDLSKAVVEKMEKNAKKYPAPLVAGSSKKYSDYSQQEREQAENKDKSHNNQEEEK
jgi:dCTP diphosphatase